MSVIRIGKPRNLSIGLLVATLLLIAVETIFFIPTISYNISVFQTQGLAEFLLPTDWESIILWMLIPIVYCSFVSILIRPKTLVNPFWVQVAVISIVILLTSIKIATTNGFLLSISTQNLGVFLLIAVFSAAFVALIGVLQLLLVSWVIRMNYEDSDQKSFVVNMQTKEILHKLGSSFLDEWSFSRRRDIGEIWRFDRCDGNGRCQVLEVGPHPQKDDKSIVATVAYEIQHDRIVRSDVASNITEMIIEDIEKRLGLQFRNRIDLDDSVSRLAKSNVKDLAQSRIEVTWGFLRKIDRFYKVIIALTIILLVGLSLIYFDFNKYVNISSDVYVEATIALVIALFVEIGVPLREELSKKKRNELEF